MQNEDPSAEAPKLTPKNSFEVGGSDFNQTNRYSVPRINVTKLYEDSENGYANDVEHTFGGLQLRKKTVRIASFDPNANDDSYQKSGMEQNVPPLGVDKLSRLDHPQPPEDMLTNRSSIHSALHT